MGLLYTESTVLTVVLACKEAELVLIRVDSRRHGSIAGAPIPFLRLVHGKYIIQSLNKHQGSVTTPLGIRQEPGRLPW